MSQHTGNVPAEGALSPMIPELPGEIRATLAPEVQAHIEALEAAQRDLRQEVDRLTVFRQLAYKDDLTGLYNRRHFGERLAQEWSRSTRFDEPLTLLLLDLDGFKLINDLAGHATGDEVLRFVARHMAAECRRFDIPCRLGGDEFAYILPGTSAEGAHALVERLSVVLATAPDRPALPSQTAIGLSFGIAERHQASSSTAFVEKADAAMYEVKRQHKSESAPPSGVMSVPPSRVFAA